MSHPIPVPSERPRYLRFRRGEASGESADPFPLDVPGRFGISKPLENDEHNRVWFTLTAAGEILIDRPGWKPVITAGRIVDFKPDGTVCNVTVSQQGGWLGERGLELTCDRHPAHMGKHHDPQARAHWSLDWERDEPYRCTFSRTGYADGLVYVSGDNGEPVGSVLTVGEVADISERALEGRT